MLQKFWIIFQSTKGKMVYVYIYILGDATPNNAEGLLQAIHLGITSGRLEKSYRMLGIRISHVQSKFPVPCTIPCILNT